MFPPTSIGHFPNEVLMSIFKNFAFPQRIRLRLVCKKWKQLILSFIPELCFRSVESHHFLHIAPEYHMYFENPFLNRQECERIIQMFSLLVKEAKGSLRKVAIGHVPSDCLTNMIHLLIAHCPNVSHLDFERNFVDRKLIAPFGPKLEALYLNYFGSNAKDRLILDSSQTSELLLDPNPTTRLTLDSGRLTELFLQQGEEEFDDHHGRMTPSVLEFVCQHFRLLNKLVYKPKKISDYKLFERLPNLKELVILFPPIKEQESSINHILDLSQQPSSNSNRLNLNSLQLVQIHNLIPFPIDCLVNLANLTNLNHLRHLNLAMSQSTLEMIADNLIHLEILEIRTRQELDLDSIQNFRQLKSLILHIQLTSFNKNVSLNQTLRSLDDVVMPSVISFRLSWITLNKKNDRFCSLIQRSFPNLKRLQFRMSDLNVQSLINLLIHDPNSLDTLLIGILRKNLDPNLRMRLSQKCKEKQISFHMYTFE